MTTFRPDTTFPFLAIARDRRLPYGQVIRAAEAIDALEIVVMDTVPALNQRDLNVIYDAVVAEKKRRSAAT
jgi:hypothetical protein